jgi:hypothetical protein
MVYRVEALEREAEAGGWQFEFDGERYTLPPDFDARAIAHLLAGNLYDGLRTMLGDEQWARLDASPKVFGQNELRRLVNAYAEGIGADLGEFAASSDSSPSTATRSKRTSNGSTGSRSAGSSRSRKR